MSWSMDGTARSSSTIELRKAAPVFGSGKKSKSLCIACIIMFYWYCEDEQISMPRVRKKCCCCGGTACVCIAVLSFIASFSFILIIIPVSIKIQDNIRSLDVIAVEDSPVLLKEVDGLWFWEATVMRDNDLNDNTTVTLFVISEDDLVFSWNNYTKAVIGSSYVVYALGGSHLLTNSTTDTFSVTSAVNGGAVLCDKCHDYEITENGFYTISTNIPNSQISIDFHLLVVDKPNQQHQCTLSATSRTCEVVMDKLISYYITATINNPSNDDDMVTLTIHVHEHGRQTWYILLVLLAIPAMLSATVLFVILICMKCC